MLTVTGVSFSSIMVTLTLASQQFGPRLLRNFLRDVVNQIVLGVLIGTFIFCLFIMRGIDAFEDDVYVPQLSVLTALGLALLCLAFFIKFIDNIANQIQAEEVVAESHTFMETALDTIFPDADEDIERHSSSFRPDGWELIAGKIGYLQAVDLDRLTTFAAEQDAVLHLVTKAGDFVSENTPLLRVSEGPEMDEASDEFIEKAQSLFFVGRVRTPEQDVNYGTRQMVEVALRALSPGINDPFTAINCIDYIGAGLKKAFRSQLPQTVFRDENNVARVFTLGISYTELVHEGMDAIRQAGHMHCNVACRLLEVLAGTARDAKLKEQQDALLHQGDLVLHDSVPTMLNDFDRRKIEHRHKSLKDACHFISLP